MKIIFFGSAEFGKPSLKALVKAGHEVALVVTQPDRPKGRGLMPGSTAIKEAAFSLGIKFFQPESVNSPESVAGLKDLKPEVFVIIAYGQKFSREVLDIPSIIAVNVHASLLPKYRGAAPINWAIINGDTKTGNTVMRVIPEMDAGPIILQSTVPIRPDDTAVRLEEVLAQDAAVLLPEALRRIEQKDFKSAAQDEAQATCAPKLTRQTLRIDWQKKAVEVNDLVRGVLNWSAAYTFLRGRILKVYETSVFETRQSIRKPGEIIEVSDHGIVVAAGLGSVLIGELQLEGKARLYCAEFLRGCPLAVGEMLGTSL